ncbi:MAG: sugar ABC transporter substrate-binding protein, partial [Schaedlerella sp.]
MKAKKIWALLLTAAMVAGLAAGCGGKKKESGSGSTDENGVTTLTFYNSDLQEDDPWTDPVAEVLTEKTGVKLDTDHPVGEDKERISLMIAEQKFPDMIYAKGDAGSLIDAGVLIDMTDLIEEYGPNIKKMYGDEFDKLKHSEDDPAIYQLSSYQMGGTKYEDSGTAQVQFAVLKEIYIEVPMSLDAFEKM